MCAVAVWLGMGCGCDVSCGRCELQRRNPSELDKSVIIACGTNEKCGTQPQSQRAAQPLERGAWPDAGLIDHTVRETPSQQTPQRLSRYMEFCWIFSFTFFICLNNSLTIFAIPKFCSNSLPCSLYLSPILGSNFAAETYQNK